MWDNKRTESGLRQDDLARFLLENVTDYAIFMLDAKGRVATWNTGAERILGYEEAQILGRHFSCSLRRKTLAPASLKMNSGTRLGKVGRLPTAACTQGRQPNLVQRRHARVARRRPSRLRQGDARPDREKARRGSLREIGDQLRKRTEELEAANRRKDEFLAMLAHELRNPLAPILNGLHILKLSDTDRRAVEKARTMMERQIGHMSKSWMTCSMFRA